MRRPLCGLMVFFRSCLQSSEREFLAPISISVRRKSLSNLGNWCALRTMLAKCGKSCAYHGVVTVQEEEPMSRTPRRSRGQNVTEYALILGVIAVVCVASVSFARDSFRTMYLAHQAPLNQSSAALAMTATPDDSIPTATPIPPTPTLGVPASTSTPIPTLPPPPTWTPTFTPTATVVPPTATNTPVPPTATPTPEPPVADLPNCEDYSIWVRWWYVANGLCD